MPAYNFQEPFVPLILTGEKCTTIRRREATVGATAYLFTGMRTKACRRLGQSEIVHCAPILLAYDRHNHEPLIKLGSTFLTTSQQDKLAMQDGFARTREMLAWFKLTYDTAEPTYTKVGDKIVYEGFLITWAEL